MSWPLASQFSAMLQNPKVAFRDPELRQCRIEKDERNQPRPWAGAFAVVYKGTAADGHRSFAVRVFTTESPERRERYDLISDYLKTRRLNCLVDFSYHDRSIRSAGDGKWYPLILMDWVQGETLFKWARRQSLARNAGALTAAADRWVELIKELAAAQISHGDLQHANVMVTESGELKLVDYDCLCVPALIGRRNLEVGVEPYQHPGRNETTLLSPTLDHFSSLVIYVALRALAADPLLWTKYVEAPEHDKLLFRREDFLAPAASPLYHDLVNASDPHVREMTEKLFSLVRVPMEEVPPLAQLADSFAKIEQLLRTQQWEAAVAWLNRRGRFDDAPERLAPLIEKAYQHVCRQEAWGKFQRIPQAETQSCDRSLLAAWNETLFAGFAPAEQHRPRVKTARQRLAVLAALHKLAQQSPKPTEPAREAQIVLAARDLPKDYQYQLRARVEQARLCVGALRQLQAVMKAPSTEAAIDAAWRKVVRVKCEGMVLPAWRPRIELARKRLPLLGVLRSLPPGLPCDQLDRRLLDVWQEDLLHDCPEADPWRAAYRQALGRQEVLRRLEQAVQTRNEAEMDRLMGEPCLAGYPLPAAWTPTIQAAREQLARTEVLVLAMQNGERASFLELFDARVIRRYAERFQAHEALLCQWIESEVLPADRMGLRRALARGSLVPVDRAEGAYRVCWTWPQQRFTDECILAVCAEEPSAGDDPRSLGVLYRVSLDRQSWESGGGSRLIHADPQWQGSSVAVWATVHVGFRTFVSHPLILGRLGEKPARKADNGRGWHVFFQRKAQPQQAAGGGARSQPAEPKDEGG